MTIKNIYLIKKIFQYNNNILSMCIYRHNPSSNITLSTETLSIASPF